MPRLSFFVLCVLFAPACEDKAKSHSATPPAGVSLPVVTEASTDFLLQYVAPDGTSKEVTRVADVPAEHRAKVRIIPMRGTLPPAGKAFVADLTKAGVGGAYAVTVVALAEFAGKKEQERKNATTEFREQSAEKPVASRRERNGEPDGTGGRTPPQSQRHRDLREKKNGGEEDQPGSGAEAAQGGIIMYATSWCGVCEKARSYFRRRKIAFVEKDIEKDAAAAAELQRKAAAQGVSARGVPVIDIRGKLIAGFDPQTIERLLAR